MNQGVKYGLLVGVACVVYMVLLHVAGLLHEFKAMDYFRRETWRLWQSNMIQHRTLDGENIEAWDEGHNSIDIGFAGSTIPYVALPEEADALALTRFWDHIRTNQKMAASPSAIRKKWLFKASAEPMTIRVGSGRASLNCT